MFERRRSGVWNFNWAGIVLAVVFVLAVFIVFRQNPPYATLPAAETKRMWTEGEIVSGPLEVEGKGILTFPLNLNKRSTLDATFTTRDNSRLVAFAVFAAADLEKWKAGERVRFVTNTGPVPRGTIKRVVEPGDYLIVFDNRASENAIRIPESRIVVE